jgi:plastocyanin
LDTGKYVSLTFFGLGLVGMSDFSALAQGTTGGTTVSVAETVVKAGETVTWKNDDTGIHTATSGKDASPDGRFDTSLVSPGQGSKPITMPNEPGQYPYFCTLHPWMEGTITVT